jgi:hypothetical protein
MADRVAVRDWGGKLVAVDHLPRRFVLDRTEDHSGVSGTGIVAEGVEFGDGTAVLRWVVGLRSTAVYESMSDVVAIHGHNGSTQVVWVD